MRRFLCLLALTLLLASCTSFHSMVKSFNELEIEGCFRGDGTMRAGNGFVASGQVAIDGVTATGGAPIEKCLEFYGPGAGG